MSVIEQLQFRSNLDPDLWEIINPRQASGTIFVGNGGAGVRSKVQLFNQGLIGTDVFDYILLERVHNDDSAAARDYLFYIDLNALTTVGAGTGFRDPALSGPSTIGITSTRRPPIGSVRSIQGGVAPSLLVASLARPVNDAMPVPIDQGIMPSTGYTIDPGVDNVAVEAAFFWWEFSVRRRSALKEPSYQFPGFYIPRERVPVILH